MKMSEILKKTDLTFEQSLMKFFIEEKKSVGFKSEKVKKFIHYYEKFYLEDDCGFFESYCCPDDFLTTHQRDVLFDSIGLEVYRNLIRDEDKDWVRYMVETYFSSPNTIEYLESKMMMRGV